MKKTFIIASTKKLIHCRTSGLMVAGLALITVLPASAITLVDRGLPTINLNNAAGNDRSNVAWADYETSQTPSDYWVPGDSFSIGNSGNYNVTDIRVWVVGNATTGLSLLGGLSGSSISTTPIGTSYTVTPVTYADGSIYQGSAGGYSPISQIDFSVNLALSGGQVFDFFVNSPYVTSYGAGYVDSFLHASNAGLSGSTQDGSDGTYLFLDVNGSGTTVEPPEDSATDTTWDKSSDINVQVLGSSVPDTGNTLLMLGLGFMGLAAFGFKQNRQAMVK